MKKVGLISLGCDKNRVDSEILLGSLVGADFEIVVDPMEADLLVVNTCAFIESAKQEALEAIFDMINVKNATGAKLVVIGCLSQRYPDNIFEEIPEIDAVVGVDHYADFPSIVNQLFASQEENRIMAVSEKLTTVEHGRRVLTTPQHYAYLKIADGCNNFCTYCSIPYIRGRYRSKKMEEVLAEANELAANGVREFILVAQDVTDYGVDLYGKRSLVTLIEELSKNENVRLIRLLYCYPEHIDDDLIDCIAKNTKVAKYVDLPLQHVNDGILKRMNRKTSKQEILDIIKQLREKVWGVAIRTTFICGFPGETDADVEELERFILEQKLTNVGFFEYCPEDGTPAERYPNQISADDKRKRLSKLVSAQYKVVFARNNIAVGGHLKVVVDALESFDDSRKKYIYVCRSDQMAPQIDGVVYVSSKVQLQLGQILRIKVTACSDYDLIGEHEDESSK